VRTVLAVNRCTAGATYSGTAAAGFCCAPVPDDAPINDAATTSENVILERIIS
jgi:hypothetical protein